MVVCSSDKPSIRDKTQANSGSSRWRIESTATPNVLCVERALNCKPAPAAIRPSASAAAPTRVTVGSNQIGMAKPSMLATRPDAVAMISGLRTSSLAKPRSLWRAIAHTAPMLLKGTLTPISTAISSTPGGPARRSATARPMNELKRNATCALAACSRRLMWLLSQGRYGKA